MRTYKYFVYILATLFMAVTTLSAAPLIVNVTFVGAGPVNDGADYVLPYILSIGGVDMDAVCYDYLGRVQDNQTWQANELTLNEAESQGRYAGDPGALTDYEDVAWLSSQLTPASTPQNQIDLQHDIWNIFDTGAFTNVTQGMQSFLDDLAAAQPGFTVSEFNNYLFVEPIPVLGTDLPQAFVIETSGTSNNGQNPGSTPEPAAWALMSAGLALIVISKAMAEARRKKVCLVKQ